MHIDFEEWLKLILRWGHVFAGIMWVGTTYFFTWLDGRFTELTERLPSGTSEAKSEPEKHIWMVHSGGFYIVEKQKVPAVMPEKLHWFRWEAAITWASGILLFIMVYYQGGLMVSFEDARISAGAAIALSVALLIVSWPVYDLILFKLLIKNELAGVAVSFLAVAGVAFALGGTDKPLFTGRAAYLQMGAILGTLMVANVWMRILPAQRRMVAALQAGQQPDQAEAARAKASSKHNTFMAVPVVFIMISNHFPTVTYGSRYGWEILAVLVLVGWWAARIIRRA
jgi:uncharacterized membrane protein